MSPTMFKLVLTQLATEVVEQKAEDITEDVVDAVEGGVETLLGWLSGCDKSEVDDEPVKQLRKARDLRKSK